MGCVFCNIIGVEHFGTEEKPEPNPFFCKTDEERKEFMDELAYDIVSNHPEMVERINTLKAKLKK